MFNKTVLVIFVCVFNLTLHGIYTTVHNVLVDYFLKRYAMTAEQKAMIHAHFEKIGAECLKENMISLDDIKSLRAKTLPSGENSSCFLACVLKKIGVMDEKGMLQKEKSIELAKKVFNDDEELKMVENYLHSCSHINNENVSDGEKGCDRALLAYKCMTENASQFGLEL